jgi:hypothetical protein
MAHSFAHDRIDSSQRKIGIEEDEEEKKTEDGRTGRKSR